MTEEEFIAVFNGCSETVADKFYPKGGPGIRRSEYLRDQGLLAALLAGELKQAGVIATLTGITAESPIGVLRQHLTPHTFGAIRTCHIRYDDVSPPETVGDLADICRAGKLEEITNIGTGRASEVLTVLARAGLIGHPPDQRRPGMD